MLQRSHFHDEQDDDTNNNKTDSTTKATNTNTNKNNNATISESKKSKAKQKEKSKPMQTIDINEAHHLFVCTNEADVRETCKYYGYKPIGTYDPCQGCMISKARRAKLKKKTTDTATTRGTRLLLDTSGPFPETPAGSRYWLKILDEYTSYCWDFFMKRKNKVATHADSLLTKL